MLLDSNAIGGRLTESIDLFLTCASFEKRCLVVSEQVKKSNAKKFVVCYYVEAVENIIANRATMVSDAGTSLDELELSIGNPVLTADKFLHLLSKYKNTDGVIAVDVTTFTRESILIILKILAEFRLLRRATFFYTPATGMSEKWLSQGVVKFRSVLGYPGIFDPRKKTGLLLLQGFELERAKATILNYEPDYVCVGVGDKNDSINNDFYNRNMKFVEELKQWYGISTSIFEHSLTDPDKSKMQIATQIGEMKMYNVILVPLNNKISTLGAGLAAIENIDVQICYSQVAEYNYSEYSSPGNEVYVLNLKDI